MGGIGAPTTVAASGALKAGKTAAGAAEAKAAARWGRGHEHLAGEFKSSTFLA